MEHISSVATMERPTRRTSTAVLKSPGLKPPALSEPNRDCPMCKGAGFMRLPLEHAPGNPSARLIPCQCKGSSHRARYRDRLLADSGLSTAMLERFSFDRFDTTLYPGVLDTARDEVKLFADEPQNWIMLHGSYGSGKTHLAIAAAGRLIDSGHAIFYGAVPRMLDELKRSFDQFGQDSYDSRWRRLERAEVLILDDLGAEKQTDWVRDRMFSLLDLRYIERQPTIVTSNLAPHEIARKISGRLGSRLADSQLVVRLGLAVPDYRQHSPEGIAGVAN